MKAVLYFRPDVADEARKIMGLARAEGVSVHWAGAVEFQSPRDLEIVDEVWTLQPEPHIEKAYADKNIKVVNKGARAKPASKKAAPFTRSSDADKTDD